MAYDFDGTNDKIAHGDIAALDAFANATIAFWLRQNTWTSGEGIMGKGSGNWRIIQYPASAQFTFQDFGPSNARGETTTTAIPVGEWHHVAVVFDGAGAANTDKLKIYVDGTSVSLTYTGTFGTTVGAATATALEVGTEHFGSSFGDITIAHLKIWSVSLTAGEVLQEVYSYLPQTQKASLILWAPYDEFGTAAADLSGQNNNGTITEAAIIDGPPAVNRGAGQLILPQRTVGLRTSRSRRGAFRNSFGPLVPNFIEPR